MRFLDVLLLADSYAMHAQDWPRQKPVQVVVSVGQVGLPGMEDREWPRLWHCFVPSNARWPGYRVRGGGHGKLAHEHDCLW